MINNINSKERFFFFWGLFAFLLISFGSYFNFYVNIKLKNIFISEKAILFVIYLLGAIFVWLFGFFQAYNSGWTLNATKIIEKMPKWLRYIIALFLFLTPTILSLYVIIFDTVLVYFPRLLLFFACIALGIVFYNPQQSIKQYFKDFLLFSVLAGAIFSAGQIYNQVVDYPFSLTYSEGNRLWDYSIIFGSDRYVTNDTNNIYAYIDWGRSYLWGLPFLFPNIGIWGVRLWDAFVKTAPYFLLGILLGSYQKKKIGTFGVLVFATWTFLFLRQGPIYSPLIISAILTIIAVRNKNLVLSILLVIIASYYASITRFNWSYAPGLWAGMLSLTHIVNPSFKKEEWKKLLRPIALGISGYFGGQFLSPLLRWISSGGESVGNIPLIHNAVTEGAFKQIFLFERWWPNPTYGPGIVFGLFIALSPAVLLMIWIIYSKNWKLNWIQKSGILGTVLVFLIVGLIASIKIGGGGDLHNMDMLIITILFLIAEVWNTVWGNLYKNESNGVILYNLSILLLIVPIFWALRGGEPLRNLLSDTEGDIVLAIIQNEVDRVQNNGGHVLFMDQRQLITFDYIHEIVLFDEYEKKLVIDKAFDEDLAYFQDFNNDLESHKFDLIVSEKLYTGLKSGSIFSEENNYWAIWVARPITEHYCPLVIFDNINLQLMIPGEDC
ncbi:MAG: hypothetical protein HOA61_01935 [Bacteroidetes bacterium]|jgi:hypothetical protein|nr:hypothetical protein [Chloroflexota bacterium]MBT6834780.1 hypothetical protein [Bacteroidota bacterium]MBT4002497.1 hypothetical protein [Chloroflexota bacterium]MBT4306216.1 hypothetical protein [Chloroflexota bacterium]MBT4534995.1 hypothetical protein [Chloroflexota bacterium]